MAPTPLELVRLSVEFLGRKGVETPRLDAEVLLASVLGVSRLQIYLQFDQPLEPSEVDAYREAVRRRGRREPVAHITGVREFWSLELTVNARVLVPRPETETLVQACLPRMGDGGRLVDLGTGSGAVALALLCERPGWIAVGVDRSQGALEVAGENARKICPEGRLALRQGDLFAPLDGELFDLIVSNPPYIPSAQIGPLEPEVSKYEPREALDGGQDGLDFIRRIVAGAPGYLVDGGLVAVEFGAGQESEIVGLFEACGAWGEVEITRDFAGRPRVAVAKRGNC